MLRKRAVSASDWAVLAADLANPASELAEVASKLAVLTRLTMSKLQLQMYAFVGL